MRNFTKIHYKYKLLLELGIDPYEAPIKVAHECLTWQDVCRTIKVHLGQEIDPDDESVQHCGKYYVTNHGRGKIIQLIDFYEYTQPEDVQINDTVLIQKKDVGPQINLDNKAVQDVKVCVDEAISCLIF